MAARIGTYASHTVIITSTGTQPCIGHGLMTVCMQDARRFSQHCCEAAAVLHHNKLVIRDFRLPNVLTRAGQEGDYVVVDLEYAGTSGQPWNQESGLAGWDDNTLTMVHRLAIKSCALFHSLIPFMHPLEQLAAGQKLQLYADTPWVYLQGVYDAMSDMQQIGLMVGSLNLRQSIARPYLLSEFVQPLVAKQVTASEDMCHLWITSWQHVKGAYQVAI